MEKAIEVDEIHRQRAMKDFAIVAETHRQIDINPNSSKIPCKFNMRKFGSCRSGGQCHFSHDPEIIASAQGAVDISVDENSPEYKTTYCKFWDSGNYEQPASLERPPMQNSIAVLPNI